MKRDIYLISSGVNYTQLIKNAAEHGPKTKALAVKAIRRKKAKEAAQHDSNRQGRQVQAPNIADLLSQLQAAADKADEREVLAQKDRATLERLVAENHAGPSAGAAPPSASAYASARQAHRARDDGYGPPRREKKKRKTHHPPPLGETTDESGSEASDSNATHYSGESDSDSYSSSDEEDTCDRALVSARRTIMPKHLTALQRGSHPDPDVAGVRAISSQPRRTYILTLAGFEKEHADCNDVLGDSAVADTAEILHAYATCLAKARAADPASFAFTTSPKDSAEATKRLSQVLAFCGTLRSQKAAADAAAPALKLLEEPEAKRRPPPVVPVKGSDDVRKCAFDSMVLHGATSSALRQALNMTPREECIIKEGQRVITAAASVSVQCLASVIKVALSSGYMHGTSSDGEMPIPRPVSTLGLAFRSIYREHTVKPLSAANRGSYDGMIHRVVESLCSQVIDKAELVLLMGADEPVADLIVIGHETGVLGVTKGALAGPNFETAMTRLSDAWVDARQQLGLSPPAVHGYGLAVFARSIKALGETSHAKLADTFLAELSTGASSARRDISTNEFDVCNLVQQFVKKHVVHEINTAQSEAAGRHAADERLNKFISEQRANSGGRGGKDGGGGKDGALTNKQKRQATTAANAEKRKLAGTPQQDGSRKATKDAKGNKVASASTKGTLTNAQPGQITKWTERLGPPGSSRTEGMLGCMNRLGLEEATDKNTNHLPCPWMSSVGKCEPKAGQTCERCAYGSAEVSQTVLKKVVPLLAANMLSDVKKRPNTPLAKACA